MTLRDVKPVNKNLQRDKFEVKNQAELLLQRAIFTRTASVHACTTKHSTETNLESTTQFDLCFRNLNNSLVGSKRKKSKRDLYVH
jgi:hypothetical protein